MIPNDRSPGRTTQGPINFAPSSRDAGLGYATRWYCIIQKTSHRRPNELPHELHLSDDGGATWRLVRPLASGTFGSIGHLVVDPVDPGVVYVNSGEGLWRFDAADRADGPVTRLSGTGRPAGGRRRRPPLPRPRRPDPDRRRRRHRHLPQRRRGRELVAGPGRPRPAQAARQPLEPRADDRQLRQGQAAARSRPTAARPSPSPPPSAPARAATTTGVISEGSCLVVWHPDDPDRIWAHGGPRHWQSDNGGRDWRPANGYFNGKQHQNWFVDQMFDPVDPDRFGYFMTDFGVGLTRNGGLWFESGRMFTQRIGLKHSTVNGGAIHPDPAKGIILASVGKMNSGTLLLSRDDGATWEIASDRRPAAAVCRLRPRRSALLLPVARALDRRRGDLVADAGAARGLRRLGDDADRAGAGRRARRSSPSTGTAGSQLAHPALARPGRELDAGRRQPVRLRPRRHDRGRALPGASLGPGRLLHQGAERDHDPRWSFGGGRQAYVDLNVMGGFPGGRAPDGMFSVMSLAIDRRFPDVMYVASAYDNGPYKFFRTTDGGAHLGEPDRGLPRRLPARARGLAGDGRGVHRLAERLAGAAAALRRAGGADRRGGATSGAIASSTRPY